MKAPGLILYKCRRCDTIVGNLHSPDITMTLISLVTGTRDPAASGIVVKMIDMHHCNDGALGITDCVGAAPDRKEPTP